MPSSRIDSPDQAAPSPRRASGSKDAPQASGVGNVAAFHAARPVRHSSCTIAGMPSRVCVAQAPLLRPQPRGPLDRIDRSRAVHAREVADAVRVWRPRTASEDADLAGHRSDELVALVDPVAAQLGDLLLERHLRRRVRAPAPIRVRASDSCSRHPFTAPVRPPTIRRSNRLKNTSAGIIDSEVNASTRAVSTEYCDANACAPSGSVNGRLVVEDEQRQQVAVPAADEGEDADGDDTGHRQREHHAPEEASRLHPSMYAASWISSGIAARNGTRMMIVVGSANAICGRMTPGERVHQPEVAHHDVQRRDRDGDREHQACGEQRVHAPRGRRTCTGRSAIAGHESERPPRRRSSRRAAIVELPPRVQNTPLGQHVDVVLRVPAHRQARRIDGDLGVRAEAADDDVQRPARASAR